MYEVLGMTSEGGVNYNVARNTLSWLSILKPICCEGRLRIMYPAPNMPYKLKWHLQNKKFSCSHECWLLFKGQREKEGNGADQLWRKTDPWQQWLSHAPTTHTCGLDWFWSTDWKRLPWYFSFVTKNQRVLFVVFMTSPFHIDISMICSKLTQPCIRMCGKLCRNKDYRCFFLCTDWISQHPFRPLVFKDNRRVLRHHLPYCLTVVWVWSNKESVEYRRSRHHCDSRPQLDSLGQYTWLVVSKPCFPANLQRYTLIFKMRLLVWESLLLPTEQCL